MKRLIFFFALVAMAAPAVGQWTVTATGDGVSVKGPAGKETTLPVAQPILKQGSERRPAPGDFEPAFANWEPWGGGKGKTINISPARDEANTHILGGLYRAIQAETVKVTAGDKTFTVDQDYKYNADWGQISGIDGRMGKDELTITYTFALQRLDLVQVDSAGKVSVKQGESKLVCPPLPAPYEGATAIAGVYVAPWRRDGKYVVAQEDIFPIKAVSPVAPINPGAVAGARKILADGGELKVAFLGDSVVLGAEAGHWWADLWTEKSTAFVSRVVVGLRKQYPRATVTPIHAAKGATTTKAAAAFFEEKIVPSKANLVVIGYGLNDAHGPVGGEPGNPPASYKDDIRAIVTKAKAMGAEVILITPFQPNPFIKSGIGQRITEYRQALIELAKEENVAVADVYTAWMQQAEQGVPPFSQLHNWINHPGPRGHGIYADTILRLMMDGQAAAGAASQPPAEPEQKAGAIRSSTTQPASIPGAWELRKDPLPDLATLLKNAKPNPHIYGLYTWKNEYNDHRKSIKEVGWKSFRVGGTIDDKAMTQLAEDGGEVMHTYSPGKIGKEPDAEAKLLEAYPKKLDERISRYGPGGSFFAEHPAVPNNPVKYWEICNEPNFQYIIPPDGRPQKELEAAREALYAKLLPAAYAMVTEKHPDAKVVGFSAGGAGAGDMRFVQNVYKLNEKVAGSYDIFSTHPYVQPVAPEGWAKRSWGGYSIASSLAVLRKTIGDQTPVWYTEIGWPVSKADGGHFDMKGAETVSPMLQAAYVVRMYAFAQRLGVQRVHIMHATDTDNYNAGFFLRDGSWRPGAKAVQTMIRLMPEPQLTEVISDGADGNFVYRFGDVIMAWRVEGTKTIDLPAKGKVTVTDMLGVETHADAAGTVAVEIGPLPMYVSRKQD